MRISRLTIGTAASNIDTREKRQCAFGAFDIRGIPSVTPNSGKDAEWRQEALNGYCGISAAATPAASNIDTREKRQCAFGAFGVRGIPSVTPNSGKDIEWRQEALFGYCGISAATGGGSFQAAWARNRSQILGSGLR